MGIFKSIIILVMKFAFLVCLANSKRAGFRLYKNTGSPAGAVFLKEKFHDRNSETPTHCGTLCLFTPNCKGYYIKENEFCKLISVYQSHKGLITADGTKYYEKVTPCSSNPNLCTTGICVDGMVDTEYTCQCPDDMTGIHCELPKTSCGGLLTDEDTEIESPGFPNNYENRAYCAWYFYKEGNYKITINFATFILENNFDSVTIYDHVNGTYEIMNKKYSGSQEPFSLASTGNKMKVKFTSDGSINKKGFQATVAFVPITSSTGRRKRRAVKD